jgi:hypothetical protein
METCPAGHECPSDGLSKPTPCDKGYFQVDTGQTSCDGCTEGIVFVESE